MVSQHIKFENLMNVRDLGGMTGVDGRKIRTGMLLRSDHLYPASSQDIIRLSELVETVADFRSSKEINEKPDPKINGVTYYHIPILDADAPGVTRDEDSFAEVIRAMMTDASIASKHMIDTYEGFIMSDFAISQYRKFVSLLFEERSQALLWHCTAGKDRTGFASVIIQKILGVNREDIIEDYLLTNKYLEPEIQRLIQNASQKPGVYTETAEKALRYIYSAQTEYLNAAFQRADEKYGGFDNYLREALGITDGMREQLREKYLE